MCPTAMADMPVLCQPGFSLVSLSILIKLVREVRVLSAVSSAFDRGGVTFRKTAYPFCGGARQSSPPFSTVRKTGGKTSCLTSHY